MPFKRVGKTVEVKKNGKWTKKGKSSSPEKAKAYLKALYANMPANEKK